jgi:hypothetical protein
MASDCGRAEPVRGRLDTIFNAPNSLSPQEERNKAATMAGMIKKGNRFGMVNTPFEG